MEPAEYYYGPFRKDLATFWRSLDERGSVSRVRLGCTPSRFATQSASHFSVVDLVARPERGLSDHLAVIPADAHVDFLCALLYTVLVDQVMYSHRRDDYLAFQAMTKYPKMDRTVGFSRTLMMANPYELFEEEILASRGLQREKVNERFGTWAPFIATDLRKFFTEHQVGETPWPDVMAAMLHDQSAIWGVAGVSLASALASSTNGL